MKVWILADKPNWSYYRIAEAIKKYNSSDLKISISHIKGNESAIKRKYKRFDKILVMGWQTYERVRFLDKSITSVGVHSFMSWDKGKTTIKKDASPSAKLIDFLSSFNGVNAVSLRLTKVFKKAGLTKVVYTPNGVDTEIFNRIINPPIGNRLIAAYSGSKHDTVKGISKYIIPAAKKSKSMISIAMYRTNSYIPYGQMRSFYNSVDCYICASITEGMSLSVLEAAACGRPIIATRVSGNTEIIKDGETGFFVERNVNEISEALLKLQDSSTLLKMSDATAKDIKDHWCWSKRAKGWTDFLKERS